MARLTFKLAISLGSLLSAVTMVAAQGSLVLTGRTTDVRIAEEKDTIVLTVSLDLTIKNRSQQNMILFWHELDLVGNVISQSADPIRPYDLFRASYLPSTSGSPYWTDLQKKLNASSPPAGLTRILGSGESVDFARPTTISIDKKGLYYASWDKILASSPVWLRVTVDMFPGNLDRPSGSQKSFGAKLKKKWSRFGILQTDLLQSEAIKLDLKLP